MSVRLHDLIGTTVYSRRVGDRAGFNDTITDVWFNISKSGPQFYFHVQDASGAVWHRSPSEIAWPSSGELRAA